MERFTILCTLFVNILGFNAVELSADMLDDWSKEQLLAAKEEAEVEVVSLTAQTGKGFILPSDIDNIQRVHSVDGC